MPIERIDSLYDVQKILAEATQVQESTQVTQDSLIKLYQSIDQFKKGSTVTNVSENWNKVTVAMTGVADASDKMNTARVQAIDGISKQSEAMTKLKVKTDQELKDQITARKALQDRTKEIIAQTDAYKALDLQYQKQRQAAQAAQATAVKTGKPEDKARADELSRIAIATNNQLKAIDSTVGESRRKVGDYTGALKVLEKQLASVQANMTTMSQAGQQDTEAFQKLSKEAELLSTIVNQQSQGFSSVTQEIRNNERALQTLRAAGLASSDAFIELRETTSLAAKEQKEFQRQQKLLESNAPVLTALTVAAKGLAGAYAVTAGTAALFADGDEKVQKEVQKLVAVMTVLQGLQEAYELIQERTAIQLAFTTTATKALTAAEEIYTFVTEGATAVTIGLRAALVASGIGAIILLIGGLVYALSQNTHALEDDLEAQEKLNKAVQDYNDALVEENRNLGEILEKNTDGLKNQIRVAEILERSIKDHEELSTLKSELEIQTRENARKELEQLGLNAHAVGELEIKYEELQHTIVEQQALKAKYSNLYDERGLKEQNMLIDYYKGQADAIKSKIERGKQLLAVIDESDKRTTELNYQDVKYAREQYEKKLEALNKMKTAYQDQLALQSKVIAAEQSARPIDRVRSLQTALEMEKKTIEDNLKEQLRDQQLNEEQKQALRYEAYLKKYNLEIQFAVDVQKIHADEVHQIAEYERMTTEDLKAEEDKRVKIAAEAAKKRHDDAQNYIGEASDIDITALDEKLKKGLVSFKDYAKQRKDIERGALQDSLKNDISYIQDQIKTHGDTADLDAQLASKKKALADTEIAGLEEIQKKKDLIAAAEKELVNKGVDLAQTAVDAKYTRELNHIQDLIDANLKLKQQELDRIESSTLSEQDKAAQVIQLNARIQASNDALAIQARKVKHDQAVADKDFAVAKAIEEGIIATLTALSEGGPVYAAIVGAISAIAIAKLIATPIPSYEVGTEGHPGGVARVHKGELVLEPGKTPVLTTQAEQIVELARHTRVIPADEVSRLMQYSTERMYIDRAGALRVGSDRVMMDISKLTEAVQNQTKVLSKVFANQKRPVVNVKVDNTDYLSTRVFK